MKKLVQLNLIILLTLSNLYTFAIDCDFVTPEVSLHDSISSNMELVLQVSKSSEDEDKTAYTDEATFKKFDKRKVKNSSSPSYLDAVGVLFIYDNKGGEFRCTAYLTSATPGESSNKLGSAAHCIDEYSNSKDINKIGKNKKMDIKKITWTTTVNGSTITKNAKVLDFDFETDQMLLEIDSPISFSLIKPLLIESEISLQPTDLIFYKYVKKLTAAGFGGDSYKGNNGKVLTYDDSIDINKVVLQNLERGQSIVPETVTFSGASGGPLIAEIDLSEEDVSNPHNQMYVIGTLKGFSGHSLSKHYLDKNQKSKGTNRPNFVDYNLMSVLLDNHK